MVDQMNVSEKTHRAKEKLKQCTIYYMRAAPSNQFNLKLFNKFITTIRLDFVSTLNILKIKGPFCNIEKFLRNVISGIAKIEDLLVELFWTVQVCRRNRRKAMTIAHSFPKKASTKKAAFRMQLIADQCQLLTL